MITAELRVPQHGDDLERLFAAEGFRHARASYAVARDGRGVRITVEAQDPTALRAALNSATQVLAAHAKAQKV